MKQKAILSETIVLVMFCIFIFSSQGVYAQFNAASIEGYVFDESGGGLDGVLIEWKNNETEALVTNFTSLATGYYYMLHTYPGTIESLITVSKPDYITNSTVISMTANFPFVRYYANFTLYQADTEAPETTVTAPDMTAEPTPIPEGHELNWTNTPVTLSFCRIDPNGTGVDYTNLSLAQMSIADSLNVTISNNSWARNGTLTKGEMVMVLLNGTIGEYFNVTIGEECNATIAYYSVDKNATPNVETAKNLTVRIDMTPPAGVSNLHELAVGSTWINWTWTNPPDVDFNYTMVYSGLGVHEANVYGAAPGEMSYINTSDFCTFDPYTAYTICTHTVDIRGNINYTWINDSARTLGHGVNVSADYYPEGNGIKIKDDATGEWVLAGEKLTIGKLYKITYQTVNDGDFDEADVDIAVVTVINGAEWNETIREHSTSLTVGQTKTFSAAEWNTTGLAPGNYTIWVNASIPVDHDESNNNRSREVGLEEALECIPDLEVEKTVFNESSGSWEKMVNASLNDNLRFRVWMHNNATCCNLTDITVIDNLSDSLKYKTGSAAPEPNWIDDNQIGWNFSGQLAHCQNITIEFNATVVDYGANWNSVYVAGLCNGEVADGSDSVDVYVPEDVTLPVIIILSPINNTVYSTTSIPLNVSADEPIDTWRYNLNGAGNVTFSTGGITANTTITVIEGANNIIVYANDTSGNRGKSSVVYFTVDTIAPTVTIDTPSEGFLTTTTTIAVNGTISESATTVKAYLNGDYVKDVLLIPDLTFNTTITMAEGLNIIAITATDAAQNTGSDTVNGTLDTIAPAYEWVSRPDAGTTGESVGVNVSATDNIGVTVYTITVDGDENAMTKNGDYYTYLIGIPSGSTAEIVYNCTFGDEAGRTNTTAETVITVTDNDEPVYEWILRPDAGTTGESVLVNVSATDNIGVTVYTITVDGDENAMTKNGDYYTYLIGIPSTSTAEIVYNCTFGDEAGRTNTTADTVITVTDNDEPRYEWLERPDAGTTGESVGVNVSATDNIGVTVYTITVDGDENAMTKNGDYYTYLINIPSTSTAEIVYNCTFGDEAGRTNTTADTVITVTDNDEPVYEWIERPDAGTTGESVGVNVSATDNIGVTVYTITVDGDENAMTKNGDYYTYLINIPSTSTAEIVYNCTFGDEAGRTNTTADTSITVTDNDAPIIVTVMLDKYEVAPSEPINVSVNTSDTMGVVSVTADGIPLSIVAGTPQQGQWYGTITAPSDAWIYTVSVEAEDAANNTAINDTVQYTTWKSAQFDTGAAGTYPSIAGIHNGIIMPNHTIVVKKMYTYPCAGTGGHTEYVAFYNVTTGIEIANATWSGYREGDYHTITFPEIFTLVAEQEYRYEIRTGSYPQIINKQNCTTLDGSFINCTSFEDVNGGIYSDWIPAIRLFP